MTALMDAARAVDIAQNHFDNASPEFIEAATYELTAAEQRLAAETHNLKSIGGKTL